MTYQAGWGSTVSTQGQVVEWGEHIEAASVTVAKLRIGPGESQKIEIQDEPDEPNRLFLLRADRYENLRVAAKDGKQVPFEGPAIVNRMALRLLGKTGFEWIKVHNDGDTEVWVDLAVFHDA